MVAATFILSSSGPAAAQNQGFGTFEGLLLTLPAPRESGDFDLQPVNQNGINTFRVASGFNGAIFNIREFAPSGALSIGPEGIGIGLSGTTTEESKNARAPLHVVGGTDNAFPEAGVLIEDRNTDEEARGLLSLVNNGRSVISIIDTTGFIFSESVFMTGGEGAFNFESLRGVGINVPVPEARLHIRRTGQDQIGLMVESDDDVTETRNMIDVVNNGPMIQQFTDTSTAEPGVFQLEARSDRFSVQQVGNQRAGFVVFEDGAVRFVANAQPNITVTPTGSLNIVGSGPGGGNLSVGLGQNIGQNAGNIFATGNITAQGDVNVGGELNVPSDVNIKEGFEEIDAKEILRKVKNLPITRWNYIKDENDTSHVGPMAQDFAAAFELGKSDKHISTIDSDGISLAAIKGLSLIMDEKDTTISAQADEIAELKSELSEIKTELRERSESISQLIENFKELKEKVSELN